LIHETKSKTVKSADSFTSLGFRIPSLQGSSDPFRYIAQELQLVEETLARAIRSREQSLTDIAAHIILGGGKRVRPAVTILAF